MSMWAVYGAHTQDILTHRGRPLVHNNLAELEYVLPGVRAVRVTVGDLRARSPLPVLWLKDHPDIISAGITFPLDRKVFRHDHR